MPDPQRCKAALECALPDTPGHRDATLILQCTKKAGHGGQHKTADGPFFWQGGPDA